MVSMRVPFVNLKKQYSSIKAEVDASIARVLDSGNFILGGEVEAFEKEFASYCGAKHAVCVSSGTEALYLSLLAAGVKRGDEVITAANTAVPTATAVLMAGATPVFADASEKDFNIDPGLLEKQVTKKTKAIIPVDLYGQCADLTPVREIAEKHSIPVIEDACQAHGALYESRKAGSLCDFGCFSFYPTKNLGAYGDAGAIAVNDDVKAEKLRLLRNYGQKSRYEHVSFGVNSRLDEIQAAVLRVKLRKLDGWNEQRRKLSRTYSEKLGGAVSLPLEMPGRKHVFHLFVVRSKLRNALQEHLSKAGVATIIHYPLPVPMQPYFAQNGFFRGSFAVASKLSGEILSLPIYPELSGEEADFVCSSVKSFFDRRGSRS